MNIWFDLSNSPHINMFGALIRELERQHEVIITCRPLANTIELLELHKLRYTVVGKHYGARLSAKAMGFGVRVRQLQRFLDAKKIDIAISQSSFHSPVVSRLLGVRSIYLNDNEYAMGNIPAFFCATRIMVPEFFGRSQLRRQCADVRKVLHFPGIKEGIYLWQRGQALLQSSRHRRTLRTVPSIYIRPEPWTAQYYKGAKNFLDNLVLGLSREARVTVLPRGKTQLGHYTQPIFDKIRVLHAALDLDEIVPDCDLFIGAGGTMTREMAVLGVPTISMYQDRLLAVDQYLVSCGAMVHRPSLSACQAMLFLETTQRSSPAGELLEKGKAAYEMIKREITH